MCVRKPGGGDTLLRGLDHPLVAKIGKAGLVEASGAGKKTGEFQDYLDTSTKVEDQEAENGSSYVGNGHGMQPREENVVIPKEFNLSGILHSLMSLDPKGDFMGPLDGFSAPNHSKGIEASMCFAMMQEKIRTRQYSTWRMFVEDFEWICYNALRCNHKRSIIWAAANDLLRRGKKRLEQYERWGESLVALNKTGGSHASFDSKLGVPTKLKSENVEARVCQHNKYPVFEGLKMAIPSATTGSPESKPPSSGAASMCRDAPVGKDTCSIQRAKEEKREDQMTRSTTPFLAPVLDVVSEETSNVGREVRDVESQRRVSEGEPGNSPSGVGQTEEDVDVEGDRDVDSEDYRVDLDGEATESSSSYDSAGSALEGEVGSDRMQSMFEAESGLRDGNGAGGFMEDDDGLLTSERGIKALDPDWKLHRRGIEWRCRWLELRTQLIKAKLSQYDKSLESLQSAKIWKWDGEVGEGTSARTVPVKILRNHPVIHRKHRRRAEDADDLDLGRHPVFSRYEKRKTQRKSDDGLPQGKVDSQQVRQTEYETDEPAGTFEKVEVEQQPVADNALVGQNSMELLLWKVEALQARVKKQQHILRKEAASSRNNTVVSKGGVSNLSPRALPQRGSSSAQEGHRLYTHSTPQKAVPRGGPPPSSSNAGAGRTGSVLARRRASDYDINNMVMPVNVGATFVEQVRHVDIETPQWRLIDDANSSGQISQESSSDEETEDERYESRHAILEQMEHRQRYVLPLKRSAGETHTVGKGKLKSGIGKSALKMTSKGSSANLALPSGSARFADTVPKRQRSNRNAGRRPAAVTFSAPSAAQARSPEVMVAKPEVKSEVSVEDAKVDPSGVVSGDAAVTTAEKTPDSESMEEA